MEAFQACVSLGEAEGKCCGPNSACPESPGGGCCSQNDVGRILGSWQGYHSIKPAKYTSGFLVCRFTGKPASTRYPKTQPKVKPQLLHFLPSAQEQNKTVGERGRYALMLLTLMYCNMDGEITAHLKAIRATQHLILRVTALLKGKEEV